MFYSRVSAYTHSCVLWSEGRFSFRYMMMTSDRRDKTHTHPQLEAWLFSPMLEPSLLRLSKEKEREREKRTSTQIASEVTFGFALHLCTKESARMIGQWREKERESAMQDGSSIEVKRYRALHPSIWPLCPLYDRSLSERERLAVRMSDFSQTAG